MKKHNMPLSYKDLHAIKHGLRDLIQYREQRLEDCINFTDEEYKQFLKDKDHEEKLLERIIERINEIKDKYKIGD